MRERRRTGGFTLLEMLAATAMVAMLAGSLYASLHIAFRARQAAVTALDTVRQDNLCMELIQADLLSAVVPSGVLAGPFVGTSGQEVWGSGAGDLTFHAVVTEAEAEPAPGAGDVKKIEYSCEPYLDTGQMCLVRRVTANLLAPQTPEPREEIIARNVRGFSLGYFDGMTWQDSWDSTTVDNVLPAAVEVTIEWESASAEPGRRISQIVVLPCGHDSTLTSFSEESSEGP